MAHYLTNAELLPLVHRYQDHPEDQTNKDRLGEKILLIANRVWGKFNHQNLRRYQDDAIQDGVINGLKNLDKFDRERGKNAFAWITSAIIYGMRNYLGKQKRRQDLHERFVKGRGKTI